MKSLKEQFLKHEIYFDEYITGNRFIDICDQTKARFCKIDYIGELIGSSIDLLITHNGDNPVNEQRYNLLQKNVSKWLGQNKLIDSNLVEGIPIGLENMILRVSSESRLGLHSSQISNAIAKARYIDKKAKEKIDHDKLIYLNINPKTQYNERQHIIDLFKDQQWTTHEQKVSWKQYYDSIARHKFVFSPRGNGVDCHRTWEALYLRTIPVVRASITMNEFKDLPILFVNNWEEISYDFLEKKYEEMINKDYDLSKLKISYWKNRIKEYFNE
tara:strand:+ start:909 stop:1724 length:816 start_codon:yes stop_codon:yes gene_type:complete